MAVALTRGSAATQLVEAADALDAATGAGRVDHRAVPHHVIEDEHAAAAGEFQRPGEVVRIIPLFGIDEDQVEGAAAFGGKLRERVEGTAQADFDDVGQAGAGDVGAGDFGVLRVGFQRDQAAAGGKARASQIVL